MTPGPIVPGSACGRSRPTFYRRLEVSIGGADGMAGGSGALWVMYSSPLAMEEPVGASPGAHDWPWARVRAALAPAGLGGGVLRLTRIELRLILNNHDQIFCAGPNLTNHNRQPSH